MSAIDQLRQLLASGKLAQSPVIQAVVQALIDQQVAIVRLTAAVKAIEDDATTISGPAV